MSLQFAPGLWLALGNIFLINVVLSGDNAIVIAMAARGLPPEKRRTAVVLGSVGAIVIRVLLTVFALHLLTLPYLRLLGGALLFYIGLKLLTDEDDDGTVKEHAGTWDVVRTILVADLVMSLDNVLGVAAAADGNVVLLAIGLALSIPLIIFGSSILLKLMERFRFITVFGAALLGYLAVEMVLSDAATIAWFGRHLPDTELALAGTGVAMNVPALCGAVALVLLGRVMARREVRSEAGGGVEVRKQ
ncbi:MAG: TerC family protein [Burkholderiaceae bacterium]